jgi:flagellar export protein FliJ
MPSGFRFRLETVLKLRRRRADDCRRAVAARLREIGSVAAKIAALETRLATEIEEARRDARPGAEAEAPDDLIVRMRRHRLYMGHLRRCIEAQQAALTELRSSLQQEQRVLTEAAKQVKVIEKLRARQLARHDEVERRAEQTAHDETALNIHRRGRSREEIGESAP